MTAEIHSRGRGRKLAVGQLATELVDYCGVMGERVGVDSAEDFGGREVVCHRGQCRLPVPATGTARARSGKADKTVMGLLLKLL